MTTTDKTETLTWDWTPEVWPWIPGKGPWAPEYGRPDTCVSLGFSTRGVRPAEAYDCWREMVFYGWDADRPDAEQRHGFGATGSGLINPRGDCYWYRSGRVSGHRSIRHCRLYEGDPVTLGLVLAGCRRHEQEGDRAFISSAGDWTLYDPDYPSRTQWDAHSGVHLTLDRSLVRRALGGDVPPSSRVVEALGQSRLAPYLAGQLRLLAKWGDDLRGHERSLLLNQVIDLALAALESSPLGARLEAGNHRNRALRMAAQTLMQRHMDTPDLSVGVIAAKLGCSRAALYRAFAEEGLTVAGYLREIRLKKVYQLLQTAPGCYTIAEIAARCGFVDSASFSRLFKQVFDICPKDLRD